MPDTISVYLLMILDLGIFLRSPEINEFAVWWQKSNERVNYILDRYHDELNLPVILDRPFYGPRERIPENYKSWLDFYQKGMKAYLEWYILKLSNQEIILNEFSFDWTRKNRLDDILKSIKQG